MYTFIDKWNLVDKINRCYFSNFNAFAYGDDALYRA